MSADAPEVVAPIGARTRRRPLWRRILRIGVWSVLLLIVLAAIGYYRATNETRLRERFLKVFAGVRHAHVHVGEISFSPWDGLNVVDVVVALEPHAPLIAGWPTPRTQPMLRIAHLNVQLNMAALLAGVTEPTAIRAEGAAITLIRDTITGRTNWSFASPRERAPGDDDEASYPRISLDDADIQLFTADAGELRLVRRWIVDVTGADETRNGEAGYGVRVDQVGGPGDFVADAPPPPAGQLITPAAFASPPEGGHAPLAAFWLAARGRAVETSIDWIDLTALDALLPPDLSAKKREMHLRGRAMVRNLRTRDGRLESAAMRLDGVSFAIPVEQDDPAGPQPTHFLQFDSFSGEFALESDASRNGTQRSDVEMTAAQVPARLRINAAGRLDQSECTLVVSANGMFGPTETTLRTGVAATSAPTTGPGAQTKPATSQPSAGDPLLAELAAMRDWPFEGELRIDGFKIPTADEHAEFVESPNLPKALRAFFKDFQARGTVDIRLIAHRGAPGVSAPDDATAAVPIRVEGEFTARGASCRYYRFPYDIEDAHGVFRFRDGAVLFEGLHGRHGAGRIRVDGRLAHTRGYGALDLTVRGHGIALDADLYAALPERYRHLWESASPLGLSDILATLHREEGLPDSGSRDVQASVDARLLSASLAAGSGQRLRQVDGTISFDRGVLTIHDLYGTLDGGGVRLNGTMDGNRKGASDANNLHLEATEIMIERTATIHGGAGAPPDRLRFVGRGDVSGRIRGSGGMLSRDAQYVVQIRSGQLDSCDGGPPWECGAGSVVMRGDRQEIRSLGGRFESSWFEGAGTLPAASGSGPPITLEIRTGSDAMQVLVPRIVPPHWRKHAEMLGLSGTGKATIRIAPVPRPARSEVDAPGAAAANLEIRTDASQQAELRVEAAAARFGPVPLPLRDLRATATLDSSGFEVQQATARYGETGELRLSGCGGWNTSSDAIDLKLDATNVRLGPDIADAMPPALASVLRKLAPTGQLQLRLDQLKRGAGASAGWEIRGEADFSGAALNIGLALTAFDGELSGGCTTRSDGQVDLAAGFTIQRGRLAGRPLERVEGQLLRTGGDRWIEFNDLRGRLCDGDIVGFGRMDPTNSEYEVSLTLQNVRLDQFMPSKQADVPSNPNAESLAAAGRMDGRVFLRGDAGDDATRRGGGELRIRGVSFLGTPVLEDVAEATHTKTGVRPENLDSIDLRFVWEGSDLKFLRVELQSRDLRLVGEGRWNMDDDTLVMTLVGANPKDWPRIAVLSDLLETAGQELMQYRVTGTKAHPKVTAEPLHNLTEPIRRLLEGK